MSARRLLSLLFALTTALPPAGARAEALAPLPRNLNEQVVTLPIGSGWSKVELETTLFSPPGPGPFPLVVINHGKASGNPRFQARARYLLAASEFVQRGYLVALPMRSGFSKSTGNYIETGCNTESNGLLQAEQIDAALAELVKRPEVDKERILLVGQSHGGLTVLAMGAKAFPGVRGIVNFAGGYRVSTFGCSWEKSMADAFAAYARTNTVPSLWFYGDNDSYWGAELPRRAFQGYREAGGQARLIAYGQFAGGDAHAMFTSPLGLPIWLPEVEKFMKEIGLPWEPRFAPPATARPQKDAGDDELARNKP